MTIRQQGGVFGRNPTFNTIETQSGADIQGPLSVLNGAMSIGGNAIGAQQIVVADDALGAIVPPRTGCFVLVTVGGNTGFPNVANAAFLWIDVGGSPAIGKVSTTFIGAQVNTQTAALVAGGGVDGFLTIAANSDGVLRFSNRLGSSQTIQVTFL
jgi:hypothetical protein